MAEVGNVRIVWKGPQVEGALRQEMTRRVKLAATMVETQVVKNLSKPFRVGSETTRYQPKRTGTPSRVGEFPRADLGPLRQSIFMKMISESTAIVGTTKKYGLFLELKGRSFLKRTLKEMEKKISRILVKPIKVHREF